jgi:hypothetical protein
MRELLLRLSIRASAAVFAAARKPGASTKCEPFTVRALFTLDLCSFSLLSHVCHSLSCVQLSVIQLRCPKVPNPSLSIRYVHVSAVCLSASQSVRESESVSVRVSE